MNISSIVVDDSDLARKSLISDIEEFCPEVKIVGEADGVVTGAKLVQRLNPDLIFLDIQMGEFDGFDLLDLLGDRNTQVIFVTASKDYAVKAFRVNAIDYLLKPIEPDLLVNAVEKIKAKKKGSDQDEKVKVMSFHTAEEVRLTRLDQIVRMQSMGNYTHVFFEDGSKLLVTKTLKEYDLKLTHLGFIRVHQSHLVNMKFIQSFVKTEGGYLLMKNGDQVSVSVRKRNLVMDILENQL